MKSAVAHWQFLIIIESGFKSRQWKLFCCFLYFFLKAVLACSSCSFMITMMLYMINCLSVFTPLEYLASLSSCNSILNWFLTSLRKLIDKLKPNKSKLKSWSYQYIYILIDKTLRKFYYNFKLEFNFVSCV